MEYNEKLIKYLSEDFCHNNIWIEDCSKEFNCYADGTEECKKCWVKSLDKLDRRSKWRSDANMITNTSWLQYALNKHIESKDTSSTNGNMTINEYIKKYCSEKLSESIDYSDNYDR